jgi:hypothetical protein
MKELGLQELSQFARGQNYCAVCYPSLRGRLHDLITNGSQFQSILGIVKKIVDK